MLHLVIRVTDQWQTLEHRPWSFTLHLRTVPSFWHTARQAGRLCLFAA